MPSVLQNKKTSHLLNRHLNTLVPLQRKLSDDMSISTKQKKNLTVPALLHYITTKTSWAWLSYLKFTAVQLVCWGSWEAQGSFLKKLFRKGLSCQWLGDQVLTESLQQVSSSYHDLQHMVVSVWVDLGGFCSLFPGFGFNIFLHLKIYVIVNFPKACGLLCRVRRIHNVSI